jgi:hypothetical protein
MLMVMLLGSMLGPLAIGDSETVHNQGRWSGLDTTLVVLGLPIMGIGGWRYMRINGLSGPIGALIAVCLWVPGVFVLILLAEWGRRRPEPRGFEVVVPSEKKDT